MKLYQKIKKLFKRKSAAKDSKSKDGATVKRLTQCPHCPECIKQIEKNQGTYESTFLSPHTHTLDVYLANFLLLYSFKY